MNCYICDQAPLTGTMRYAVAEAIGVCRQCGIGVCVQHSHKEAEPGSPLLCVSCAGIRNASSIAGVANDVSGKKTGAKRQ